MNDVRVLVADDQALLRGSFRVLIDNEPGLTVVGEAATGREAVDVAGREHPDKDTPPGALLTGVRLVASGEGLLAPSVTRRLIEEFARGPEREPRPPARALERAGITDREREVLTLVARGLTNSEIADRLRLSVPTVKTHVSHLLTKLDSRDRAQLVIVAYETGLVSAGQR